MSLRERFQNRQLPTATVALPVDPSGYAAAERRCEAAVRALQVAQARGVEDLTPFRREVDEADRALAEQPTFTVTLRSLSPHEWDELVEEFPPTDEQRKQGMQWNIPEFRPALLAACVVVPDGERALSEHEWAALAHSGQIAVGELDLLFITAVNLCVSPPRVSTGKGWSTTVS